jgi:hypothetical protein
MSLEEVLKESELFVEEGGIGNCNLTKELSSSALEFTLYDLDISPESQFFRVVSKLRNQVIHSFILDIIARRVLYAEIYYDY